MYKIFYFIFWAVGFLYTLRMGSTYILKILWENSSSPTRQHPEQHFSLSSTRKHDYAGRHYEYLIQGETETVSYNFEGMDNIGEEFVFSFTNSFKLSKNCHLR